MALENKYGKSAVDATKRNALPPYLDELFAGGIGGAGVETHDITLTTSGWSNLQQSIVLTCGATDSSDVICAANNTSMDSDYYMSAFGVSLSNVTVVEGEEEGQNTVTFTFTAVTAPTVNINVVVVIINADSSGGVPVATTSRVGVVKPDGTTISIDSNGTIHSIGGGGGGAVSGVKGDAESTYRTGNVNITAANVGAVPTSRTVNGHALSSNVTVTASDVGLGNVNNTSDLNKPISTATQTALNAKVDKETGKGLSSNDFTDTLLSKLNGIEAGAQVNTVTGVKGNSESSYRVGNVNITKANIGLGNVDNTSDLNKPISTATQTALNNKVDITDVATTSDLGLVMPDGTTITVDADGTIHAVGGGGGGEERGLPTTLLWENPSPTSSFAAQTVSVDLSEYDLIAIDYLMVNNATTHCWAVLGVTGLPQRSIDGQQGSLNITTRDATPSATGVVFGNGYLSATQNNIYMIPYKIYGIGAYGNSSLSYFTNQTVSVASNAEILRIIDPRITTATVVLECTFANPSAISGTVSWTSYNGYISFIGTCTSATTANVTLNGASFNELYPIGSVVCMSTNTNPSSKYGGTWELIDKEFKLLQIGSGNYTSYFTANASTTIGAIGMYRNGHALNIVRLSFSYASALSDTTSDIGTLNLEALGINSILYATYCHFNSDGGNGIALAQITTAGAIQSIDVVTKTSGGTIAAESNLGMTNVSINLIPSQMADSACDKFYFKRTA